MTSHDIIQQLKITDVYYKKNYIDIDVNFFLFNQAKNYSLNKYQGMRHSQKYYTIFSPNYKLKKGLIKRGFGSRSQECKEALQ